MKEQDPLKDFAVRAFWHLMDKLDILAGDRLVTCPVCGLSERKGKLDTRVSECIFGGGRLERYVCPKCGCIFGPSKYLELPSGLVSADYALLYSAYSEGDNTAAELRSFRSLRPSRESLYLNYGCGRWSKSIQLLREEGFDVWGYDPVTGRDNPFVVSSKGDISASFDGIWSNNVIEHMTDPVDEFAFFHRVLKPGGRMAHASPCYRYAFEFSRFHVVFLTGKSAYVLAERTGFRIIDHIEDGDFINFVFERT